MPVTIGQIYLIPRSRQPLTLQKNLVTAAIPKLDVGESAMLGLGAMISSVTVVPDGIQASLQIASTPQFELQFTTLEAQETAVQNLWSARFSELCKQAGVTCTTTITLVSRSKAHGAGSVRRSIADDEGDGRQGRRGSL